MQEPGTSNITFPKSVDPVFSRGGRMVGAWTRAALSISSWFRNSTGILAWKKGFSSISAWVSVIRAAPSAILRTRWVTV